MADFLRKDVAKRDMDFFSVFTATKKKATRVISCAVLIMVFLMLSLLGIIAVFTVSNIITQSKIDKVRHYIDSDECKALKKNASDVALALQDHNSYLYSLTAMEFKVTSSFKADASLKDTLQENLPKDIVVQSFSVADNVFSIKGATFSYYAPTELIKLLNDTGIFSTVDTIDINAEDKTVDKEDVASSPQNEYTFSVTGSLSANAYVSTSLVSLIDNDKKALGAVEYNTYKIGDTVTVNFPKEKYTADKKKLIPTSITVNGEKISDEKFQNAMISCSYDDILTKGTLNVVVVYELEEVVNSQNGNAQEVNS